MSTGAKPACEADGCDAVAENVGLCWMHRYKQLYDNEESINRFNVKRLDAMVAKRDARISELEAALRDASDELAVACERFARNSLPFAAADAGDGAAKARRALAGAETGKWEE